jgi:protein SCO1/2
VVTLFFGYTQCPDVCPTNLLGMAEVMRQLGRMPKVQVLFITVDPERDTQALLAEYVPAFDKRFTGLYGDVDDGRRGQGLQGLLPEAGRYQGHRLHD